MKIKMELFNHILSTRATSALFLFSFVFCSICLGQKKLNDYYKANDIVFFFYHFLS